MPLQQPQGTCLLVLPQCPDTITQIGSISVAVAAAATAAAAAAMAAAAAAAATVLCCAAGAV